MTILTFSDISSEYPVARKENGESIMDKSSSRIIILTVTIFILTAIASHASWFTGSHHYQHQVRNGESQGRFKRQIVGVTSNLVPTILMIGGSVALVIVICFWVTTRVITAADPMGICRDCTEFTCGGCGLMEEMNFCCTIS